MQAIKLFDNVSEITTSKPLKISGNSVIPFQIFGVIDANVILEATISSDTDISLGNADWSMISNGSFIADTCDGIFVSFSHIRARIVSYNSGSISVVIGL